MDKNVTVSMKGVLAAGLVLVALVVAYLLGQGGGTTTAAAADSPADSSADTTDTTADAADARTLTMRGVGTVTAVPDQVGFDVTVRVTRPDVSVALDDTNDLLDGVLTTLDDLGIARKDVETTALRMNPSYDYVDNHRVFRGYHVEQSVAVLVRDLGSAGKAISGVVESGGNAVRVGDISLRVGDPEAALAEARGKAVEAATAKAQEYADATGQTLGDVMTLVEVNPADVQSQVSLERLSYNLASADAAFGAVPIRAGRSDVGVTVQIVWDLG